ncbi:MAG: glycoside hydrolase family 32 protein [Clostridia bacterium]|nr:glycoside hydrolase family 32 protein [Clostridia bacterium]
MSIQANYTRKYREKMLADSYRPGYHFTAPDGNAHPGDPNGAFFADGRYHLMYLYYHDETDSYHWGHMSSLDLLHWRHHPDALTDREGDRGCFSGGAFVDEDGTAYLTFWKFASVNGKDNGGIAIAKSPPPYDVWERMEPIAIEGSKERWGTMDLEIGGQIEHISCADPSNIWKTDGWYYMQTGNLVVLNNFGREENSEEKYRGDWTDLFRSRDLLHWEYVHRFYKNPHLAIDYPDATEDDMCPTILPLPDMPSGGKLTDKWLQTFIAHNKGGQYYIGTIENETYIPTEHGRFSWKDNTCFAPEAMLDNQNRHICWFWLRDNIQNEYQDREWSGVYSFPRVFWYDNGLKMAPAKELDKLQYNGQTFTLGVIAENTPISVKNGASFRLQAVIRTQNDNIVGFRVRANTAGTEFTDILVDKHNGKLIMDTTNSGKEGCPCREEAPFVLKDGEELVLDLFVDRSVIEVYANNRQAICRRGYPTDPADAVHVYAVTNGSVDFGTVEVWEMMETNMY